MTLMKRINTFFKPIDMTEGNPLKNIILFIIPLLVGNIAQQLYHTVDSIIIGNFIGDNALAAVGMVAPIINLFLVLFMGISVGTGIMTAQYFGAKDGEKLSRTIASCIVLTLIISVIIMLSAPYISKPILNFIKAPATIYEWSNQYLQIMLLGVSGTAFFNIFSGIMRGMGNSTDSLIYLLIATFINIFLDTLFVAVFKLEVVGVAIATIISQVFTAILCVRKVLKKNSLYTVTANSFKNNHHFYIKIIKYGIPNGITQVIMSFSLIAVQSLTNSFGETFIAASVVLKMVDGFAMLPSMSFGAALSTYVGQNIGAKRYDRVRIGSKKGSQFAILISCILTLSILIFGPYLMAFFTDTQEVIRLAMRMMYILSIGYIMATIIQCLGGIMRGSGFMVGPMIVTFVSTVVIRVPLAYFIAYITKSAQFPMGRCESVYISLLISWIIGAVLSYLLFKHKLLKNDFIVE